MQHARGGDFVKERDDRQPLTPLFASSETDLGERAIDNLPETHQTPAENCPGAATDADGAFPQHMEGEERRVEDVPQLVGRIPETLDFVG